MLFILISYRTSWKFCHKSKMYDNFLVFLTLLLFIFYYYFCLFISPMFIWLLSFPQLLMYCTVDRLSMVFLRDEQSAQINCCFILKVFLFFLIGMQHIIKTWLIFDSSNYASSTIIVFLINVVHLRCCITYQFFRLLYFGVVDLFVFN